MPKAIKCTISGLELDIEKGIGTMHYIGRTENGVSLIGIPLDTADPKTMHEIPMALVFNSIRQATTMYRIVNEVIRLNDPNRKIHLSINRLDAKNSNRNNRISLTYKTRSI